MVNDTTIVLPTRLYMEIIDLNRTTIQFGRESELNRYAYDEHDGSPSFQ